jgi:23S rRNA (adenine2503-C2)-methyltransferase
MVHLPTKEEEEVEKPAKPERSINLIGLTREEMQEEFVHFGIEKYRATQVFQWIYGQGAQSLDEMPTIGRKTIEKLKEHYYLEWGATSADSTSNDGTRKWLVDLGQKQCVETVFIPESKRGTLCVSSQIGCTMSCSFCHTGTQPLVRNLQAGEIVTQVLAAKKHMYDFPKREERVVSNIVYMGQGEPFYNYRNVKKSIQIITDSAGIAISKRRITVSTSGIVPNIKRLGEDFPGINLAISLHAVNDELRNAIVPANRQWPIAELIEACKAFPGLTPMRRIAFEYVMLKGINDSEADAHELVRLLKGFPSFLNIIPFNPWPGSIYETSSNNQIMRFAKIITDAGIDAPIRWPRGRDILAACGQLKTETTKQRTPVASL